MIRERFHYIFKSKVSKRWEVYVCSVEGVLRLDGFDTWKEAIDYINNQLKEEK